MNVLELISALGKFPNTMEVLITNGQPGQDWKTDNLILYEYEGELNISVVKCGQAYDESDGTIA